MELVQNYQITLDQLCNERIDYFIAASGFQKRSTFLAENLKTDHAKKWLLHIEEGQNPSLSQENESKFEKMGFHFQDNQTDEKKTIGDLLSKICQEKHSENINILVDYSCMTKNCYASIIDFFLNNDLENDKINMFFSYTPKSINALPTRPKIKCVEPLFNPAKKINDRPNALVIGLYSNPEPTKELIRQVGAEKTIFFLPSLSHDPFYHQSIIKYNEDILRSAAKENLYDYPAQNPDRITSVLTPVCLDLRLQYNVILVPQGPKTFALASILLSTRYPDIRLLQITSQEKRTADEGIPAGDPVIIKSVFCPDDQSEDF